MTAQGAKSPLQNWDNTKQPLGKTYRIPCSWEMYGVMEVKAESLKEAIEQAYCEPLPNGNSAYIEASFKVDKDIVEDYNEENCL